MTDFRGVDKKKKEKKENTFDTTARRRNIFTMMFCWLRARVVAVLLVVINRIYLHHNLERLIYAPSFWYQVFAR